MVRHEHAIMRKAMIGEGELNSRNDVMPVQERGMQILGLYGQLGKASPRAPTDGRVMHTYMNNVARTIGAGSSEIQRSLISTRGLGLPSGR